MKIANINSIIMDHIMHHVISTKFLKNEVNVSVFFTCFTDNGVTTYEIHQKVFEPFIWPFINPNIIEFLLIFFLNHLILQILLTVGSVTCNRLCHPQRILSKTSDLTLSLFATEKK